MKQTKKDGPSVPGGLQISSQGSGWVRWQSEGAKNHRVRSGYQGKRKMYIATYNTRTLSNELKILELEEELKQIHWDIVGLSEVRRRGEEQISLKSGNTFYYRGNEESSDGGVGFIIHKRLVSNILHLESISPRVCFVVIKLNQRYSIKVIQVYAPTSTHTDEEVEMFYDDVAMALSKAPTYFSFITGDFNAKIGKKEDEGEFSLGQHGIGERNERGNTLLQFLLEHGLYAMNTFFKKAEHRKWTWKSPDGNTKNEIDFVITGVKRLVQDVTVLNQLSVGSDHRMVRATVKIDVRAERRRLINTINHKWTTVENIDDYQRTIGEHLRNIDEMDIETLNSTIKRSIEKARQEHCVKVNQKDEKLSRNTRHLMKQRREMLKKHPRDENQLKQINKTISGAIRRDVRDYNKRWVMKTIEENKSMKVLRSKLTQGKTEINKLENKDGQITTNKKEILEVIKDFYSNLYGKESEGDDIRTVPHILNQGSEELLEITAEEVRKALSDMKNGKTPGEDNIVIEAVKDGGEMLLKAITALFNKCLIEAVTPVDWNNAEIVIIHKKGNITNLNNYRPISLLSHLYKLFTKIITKRLESKLDFYQPPEQAGFRSGYGTNDHLQVIKTLIEKSVEYNKPLVLVFVDYEKAFDSIKQKEMFKALADCRVDHRYSAILQHIYHNATANVRVYEKTEKFKIQRGVRQGDTISPKLFTTLLEYMFKNIELEGLGINIDGKDLNHLRFADDIILISDCLGKAEEMLSKLTSASHKVGLKINPTKTEFMTNLVPSRNLLVQGKEILQVTSYKYLGHELRIGRDNQTCEIERRIGLTWAAYGKLRHVFKSEIPICLKRKVFDQCILPVLSYGSETSTLTRKSINKVRVAQRAMERSILGISLRDRVPNERIRQRTGITDAIERIAYLKWNWAGHVARMPNEKWTKRIMEWRPRDQALRSRGRPPTRWTDDIKRISTNWIHAAQDRNEWRLLREAYVQQWTRQDV